MERSCIVIDRDDADDPGNSEHPQVPRKGKNHQKAGHTTGYFPGIPAVMQLVLLQQWEGIRISCNSFLFSLNYT